MTRYREIAPQVKLVLLLGRFPVYFGLLFLCFSLPIVTFLLRIIDFTSPGTFQEAAASTAVIERVEDTPALEENHRIRAFSYRFTDDSGKEFTGISYSGRSDLSIGSHVEVLYVPDDPELSRLTDMRRKPFGPGLSFTVILPLVGLAFLVYGVSRYPVLVDVLRSGEPGTAYFVGKQPTMARVNGKTLYAIQYEYRSDGARRRHYFTVHSTKDELLQNTEPERSALHLASRRHTVLLDALPGNPTLTADGRFVGRVNGITVFTLVFVALFLVTETAILAIT